MPVRDHEMHSQGDRIIVVIVTKHNCGGGDVILSMLRPVGVDTCQCSWDVRLSESALKFAIVSIAVVGAAALLEPRCSNSVESLLLGESVRLQTSASSAGKAHLTAAARNDRIPHAVDD
jgi:hypothetical protein